MLFQATPRNSMSPTSRPSGAMAACGPDAGAASPSGVDALAVAEVDGLLLVELDDGEQGARGIGGRDQGRRDVDGLEVAGIRHPERTDPRASQRGQVTADAEAHAEVAGERADVGAGRALDAHLEVEVAVDGRRREQLEGGDRDGARLQLDGLPGSHPA